MSRPVSVVVTRLDPTVQQLKKIYKKSSEAGKALRVLSIINMIKHPNAEIVAEYLQVDADTVRRWVQEYNDEGVASFEKKSPLAPLGD